jgi:hypothetical protein
MDSWRWAAVRAIIHYTYNYQLIYFGVKAHLVEQHEIR